MRPEALTPAARLWPPPASQPCVLLVDAPSDADRTLIDRWLADARATSLDGAEMRLAHDGTEAATVAAPDDAWIVPVRVAWLPPGVDGDRRWRARDLVRISLESGLPARSRERILASEPSRCRILVGDPAPLSELRERMDASTDGRIGRFIERQARLTLDRAERSLTGARYKVPHDLEEQLISDRRFQAGLAALAASLGRPVGDVRVEALRGLEEMASRQSALARELWVRWARLLYSRAYELCYDRDAVKRLRELSGEHPLVFLPTHKSNLDGYVLAALLYEEGFPPNHTLGGINMAFWPVGPLGRRVGVIWIRRAIKEDPVYRWVLRQYLGYLVKRRFNLEWYLEGGRTRTGKLLPPKMGLLHYLVDAVGEAEIEDVQLVPVSIVYDQLEELAEMTAEARGAIKPAEGLRWMLDYARRQSRPAGRVQVSFGEPLAMTPALAAYGEAADPRLALAKLAFDVCTRINHATPITRTGFATLALHGGDGRSLTADEVISLLEPLQRYAEARSLPGVEDTRLLCTRSGIEVTLAQLVDHRVVSCYDAGPEPVYTIGRENELVAAFHRNTVIHWFVNRAIAELALVRGVDSDPAHPADAVELAWAEAYRLRDVLKFEFFFADQARFRDEMKEELAVIAPEWSSAGSLPLADVGRALVASGALVAHRVLASFLEAYHVVAECLASEPPGLALDRDAFLHRCLHYGEQLRRQHRISSGEAVSIELFKSALQLAGNRGLLEAVSAGGADALASARAAFAEELRDLVRRVQLVSELDGARRDHLPALASLAAA
ncbi:MAG: glycerol-3-phosphate 1-O-acyltransferase [Solirubrobacteraceae bacterium]